ncbi:MAG TPA: hypothetical protein VH250_01150 [Granulicella sp.]|nr:hypothetical protein [Granulicella sp.]
MNRTQVFFRHGLGWTLAFTTSLTALAQTAPADTASLHTAQSASASSASSEANLALPDAPGYSSSISSISASTNTPAEPSISQAAGNQQDSAADPSPVHATTTAPARTVLTSPYDKYIDTHEIAPPLDARDKMILGLRATITPFGFLSIVTAAGFEQLRDSSPHYGTDRGAFAARVGAAGARDASELIFSDSLLAPVFHEDPRYYQLGRQRRVFTRITYAMSRVFVTRTDDGRPTPNYSLLAGYAGAIGLSNTYYPANDRSFKQSAENYCGSLGGAAFAFVVREFLDEALLDAHLRKRE